MKVYTLEDYTLPEKPEILFWVGCAGSFDPRAQKITKALVTILNNAGIKYAVLGNDESCTGDPARRAGNEFLFQMMALQNIETIKMTEVNKIVTACPHCFNTIKNEYPALGGTFEVMHHTVLIQQLIDEGKITIEKGAFKGKKIAYHDSCYLGRANGIYEAPRAILEQLDTTILEAKRNRSKGFCCGAGGAQVFKEEEKSDKKVNHERVDELLDTGADIIAANCPYCILMVNDGIKSKEKDESVSTYDLSELIVQANKW
ncbi:MAG: (Fe-S)-binding protein [Saprospiraceae bacterium]|nr:(Fe-S)-binding protein [Saprospiraceae bacterium]